MPWPRFPDSTSLANALLVAALLVPACGVRDVGREHIVLAIAADTVAGVESLAAPIPIHPRFLAATDDAIAASPSSDFLHGVVSTQLQLLYDRFLVCDAPGDGPCEPSSMDGFLILSRPRYQGDAARVAVTVVRMEPHYRAASYRVELVRAGREWEIVVLQRMWVEED